MHNAAALGFRSRRLGDGPVRVQNLPVGQPITQLKLGDAKTAILKKADERVLVQSIRPQKDGTFIGTIYGFEPSHSLEFQGMKVKDELVFEESHVFSCGD